MVAQLGQLDRAAEKNSSRHAKADTPTKTGDHRIRLAPARGHFLPVPFGKRSQRSQVPLNRRASLS
jgi:hypothetical protein